MHWILYSLACYHVLYTDFIDPFIYIGIYSTLNVKWNRFCVQKYCQSRRRKNTKNGIHIHKKIDISAISHFKKLKKNFIQNFNGNVSTRCPLSLIRISLFYTEYRFFELKLTTSTTQILKWNSGVIETVDKLLNDPERHTSKSSCDCERENGIGSYKWYQGNRHQALFHSIFVSLSRSPFSTSQPLKLNKLLSNVMVYIARPMEKRRRKWEGKKKQTSISAEINFTLLSARKNEHFME